MSDKNDDTKADWSDADQDWEPEDDSDFISKMQPLSSSVLARLLTATDQEKMDFLTDTRAVHKELYSQFVPSGREVLAGNYRGLIDTELELWWPAIDLKIPGEQSETVKTIYPTKVEAELIKLNGMITNFDITEATKMTAVMAIMNIWKSFLNVHPYANGNGHVSRLLFAVLVSRTQWSVDPAWTINPSLITPEVKIALQNMADMDNFKTVVNFLMPFVY